MRGDGSHRFTNGAKRSQGQGRRCPRRRNACQRGLIRESIHGLYGTGRFSDIRVEAEATPDNKVILTIFASPNYFVGEVRAEGAPRRRPTAGQIVNASKLTW